MSETLTISFIVISLLNFIGKRLRRTTWAFQQCRSNSIATSSRGLAVQCFFPFWTCVILNSIWKIWALGWGFERVSWIFNGIAFVKWVLESESFYFSLLLIFFFFPRLNAEQPQSFQSISFPCGSGQSLLDICLMSLIFPKPRDIPEIECVLRVPQVTASHLKLKRVSFKWYRPVVLRIPFLKEQMYESCGRWGLSWIAQSIQRKFLDQRKNNNGSKDQRKNNNAFEYISPC